MAASVVKKWLRAIMHCAVAVLRWCHLVLVKPLVEWSEEAVLGNWEESLIVFVREGFVQITRGLGAIARWILSIFDPKANNYKEKARRAWQQHHGWQERWVNPPLSTLNQIIHNTLRKSPEGKHPSPLLIPRPVTLHACCKTPHLGVSKKFASKAYYSLH